MTLAKAFRDQSDTCIRMGSPFMGQLLGLLAEHWPEQSALGQKLSTFQGDVGPAGHSLPLRIAGGLHALVLKNQAPALKSVFPPYQADDAALCEAVLETLKSEEQFLLDWIESAPQTNEVRRSAALIAGAHVALSHFNLPIHLSELGASAGLNLMWDQYSLDIKGHRFGAPMPVVILAPDWTGTSPPEASPRISARAGVDLNPLDPKRHDHLLRLIAYVWPDQPDRLSMTRAAASIVTTQLAKGDAIDWLAPRLHSAPQGRLHLIQHTVAWQYFTPEAQARGTALIEAAGAQAKPHRPLAWLSMESDGDTKGEIGAALTLRLWPGDIRLDLGRVDFHGRWVKWAHDPTTRS